MGGGGHYHSLPCEKEWEEVQTQSFGPILHKNKITFCFPYRPIVTTIVIIWDFLIIIFIIFFFIILFLVIIYKIFSIGMFRWCYLIVKIIHCCTLFSELILISMQDPQCHSEDSDGGLIRGLVPSSFLVFGVWTIWYPPFMTPLVFCTQNVLTSLGYWNSCWAVLQAGKNLGRSNVGLSWRSLYRYIR